MVCLLTNQPEVQAQLDKYTNILGSEDAAYYVLSENNGYELDKAPNGQPSKLFSDLLSHYNGDEVQAIRAKAKLFTESFKNWFGDWVNNAVPSTLFDAFKGGKIIFGHPGIGKTYSVEQGKYSDKFIDWDVEYNQKRDKWIEEHSGTKKGTPEYKKARNEYLIYPEKHPDYVKFLTQEWNRVKEKARKENKVLLASPHTLLKFFPQDFDLIINVDRDDFINRNVGRGGKKTESGLWKDGIDRTISSNRNIPQHVVSENEYLEDVLDKVYGNNVSKVVDENGEPSIDYILGDYNPSNQNVNSVNKRRKSFTSEDWQLSNRISNVLRTLFPEISMRFVEALEEGKVGQMDLDALEALIHFAESGMDTIPHEYAHYYIAMFRDSALVKKGIEQFGSEEALVQAIGERTVEMRAEVRKWWQKLFDYIKKLLNKNKYTKEILLAELTDAFLSRRQIGEIKTVRGRRYQSKMVTPEEVRDGLTTVASQIEFDEATHTYTVKSTGKKLASVTQLKQNFAYDTYDAASEDADQKDVSNEARQFGTSLHAVFQQLANGTFHRESFPDLTDEAIEGARDLMDKIKSKYEIVATEAVMADPEYGVAGTTDLLLRNKKTGKYVILDYKSKLWKYNKLSKNKAGKKLYGFKYITSTRFNLKSQKDGYDFQLSAYEKMLKNIFGDRIEFEERGIIPILYERNDKKITRIFLSNMFGTDEEYNETISKKGFASIEKSKQVQFDVDYSLFGDKDAIGGDTELGEAMVKDLRNLITRITKKLSIQADLQKLRGFRTFSREAQRLYERINGVTELNALFHYLNYGIKQLSALNATIERFRKEGSNAKWNLAYLRQYNDLAATYNVIQDIQGLVRNYQNLFNEEDVKEITAKCSRLASLQRSIQSAYDTIGRQMYLDSITPFVKNVEYEMIQTERKQYAENNPKKSDETKEQFEQRVQQHLDEWKEENAELIQDRTKDWLKLQTQIADEGFECSSITANVQSVYESRDPFVQSMVSIFDSKMNDKVRKLINYRSRITKILKAYKQKYGGGNLTDLRKLFDDLIDISEDNVAYLVNSSSATFLAAEKKMKKDIMNDPELNFLQKQEAIQEWYRTNTVIDDPQLYIEEYKKAVNLYLENLEGEIKKEIEDNILISEEFNTIGYKKDWYTLYKDGKISFRVKEIMEEIKNDIDAKYRIPNKAIWRNDKYDALMALDQNDPKRQMWALFTELLNTVDYSMPSTLRLNYRLPTVLRRGFERLSTKGVLNTVKNNVQRNTIIMSDDDIRGTFINDDGKKLNQIPMYYFYNEKVSIDEQSFDLPTIFYKWLESALDYQAKRSIEEYILITQSILHTRETETNRVSLLNKKSKEMVTEVRTGTSSQFDEWVNQVFYGNRLEDLGSFKIPFSNKRADIAKTIKTIVGLSTKTVMLVNWVSAINNFLVAEAQQAEEAVAGEFFSKESYTRATQMLIINTKGILADMNNPSPKNFINQLAEWFAIGNMNPNLYLAGVARHTLDDFGYLGTTITDRIAVYRLMLAFLIEQRALDKNGNDLGSMIDFLSFNDKNELVVDSKVANFTTKDQDALSLKIRRVKMSLHGNTERERAAVALETKWYGVMGLALRRWIEPGVERRYNIKHFSNLTGTARAGMYRSSFSWLLYSNPGSTAIFNFIGRNVLRMKDLQLQAMRWDELDDTAKRNIIRLAVEAGISTISILLYAAMGSGDDGEEPSDIVSNLRYQLYRLYTDLTFFILPTSFTKILKDPFPVVSYVNNIIGVFMQLFNPLEEYENGHHTFDNVLLNKLSRVLPIIKQVGRWSNIEQEMEMFTRR